MKPSSETFGSQTSTLTREQWLGAITSLLRPRFAAIGSPLPDGIAVSCGWPSQNGRARKNRVIGECWKVEVSAARRMTATVPGDQLRHDLVALTEQIGQPYPHGEIHAPADDHRQSTRMLKLQCPGCGYVIRTTRTWLDQGVPVCCCGEDFEVAT